METMDKKTLCIATRNANKTTEMALVLAPLWVVKSSVDYPEMEGLDEITETGDTFLANAQIKGGGDFAGGDRLRAGRRFGPGMRCARRRAGRFLCAVRWHSLLHGEEQREAAAGTRPRGRNDTATTERRFRCVLVLAKEGEVLGSFEGACEGTIALGPKGTHGFGYDPLFIPQGYARTFGQLGEKTKITLSHRGLALKQFVEWCKANPLE